MECLAYFTASLPKLSVIIIVGHRVLGNVSRRVFFVEIGKDAPGS